MSCPDCFRGKTIPGDPKGSQQKIGGVENYVAIPSTPNVTYEKSAIIYLPDIFGPRLVNNKILSDVLADRSGMPVYFPDILNGDYPDPGTMPPPGKPLKNHSIFSKISDTFSLIYGLLRCGMLGVFFRNVRGEKIKVVLQRIIDTAKALKEEKGVTHIGLVGYCLGGFLAVKLADKPDLFNAAVPVHAGGMKKEVWDKAVIPLSFGCAEEDHGMSPELLAEMKKDLEAKPDLPTEFIVYKGTRHGYACRPDLDDPEIKEAYEKTIDQVVFWFQKYLV